MWDEILQFKNPAFSLVRRFLAHNSRTIFFPDLWFLQKVRGPLVLSYSSKKRTYEWIWLFSNPSLQNLVFAFSSSLFLFYNYLTSSKKSEKYDQQILGSCFANERTNKAKFMDTSPSADVLNTRWSSFIYVWNRILDQGANNIFFIPWYSIRVASSYINRLTYI